MSARVRQSARSNPTLSSRLDPDPQGSSGDRGTPFIGRDEMIAWLRRNRGKPDFAKTMIDAIIEFIDRNGRGGEG